eukprot:gnl/TRDRNA2_/TRDRNA2_158341_c1_seq1.p1 gnl/TRDRNA2_/TRDRNA2_158341_c1~~gnl/TRDRNA2_/TRDRNA2_158341_c1_seq1.p1  ORF type:complete len:190 (+),score=77.96 gnl/TRDRNA2_/TRDRNA2_158341_c1_seq1:1-570(+)
MYPLVLRWVAEAEEEEEDSKVPRPPLWLLVRFGLVEAVECQLVKEGWSEAAGKDVMTALLQLQLREPKQSEEAVTRLEAALRPRIGEELWPQLEQAASTEVLVFEMQEACSQWRAPDEKLVAQLLEAAADANAAGSYSDSSSEESDDDDEDEDDEESSEESDGDDEDEEEEEDEDEDNDEEEDEKGSKS